MYAVGDKVTHLKTGRVYVILMLVTETTTGKPAYVYEAVINDFPHPFVRSATQMEDGRFAKVR